MEKLEPDYSFEREGADLAEWLIRLVGDDRAMRDKAGEVLIAMQYGFPSSQADAAKMTTIPDMRSQQARFNEEMRRTVERPGFDTAEFVTRLCAYRMMVSRDWLKTLEKERERTAPSEAQWNRVSDKLVHKINESGKAAEIENAGKRLGRVIAAMVARECRDDGSLIMRAEAVGMGSMAAHMIFEALDRAFLTAPEALEMMLGDRQKANDALGAIGRMRKAGKAFVPRLFALMDGLGEERWKYLDGPVGSAMGKIAAGDGEVIDQLIARLGSPVVEIQQATALAFLNMETDLAGREAQIISRLMPLATGDSMHIMLDALASVGRNDAAVRSFVIDLARPRPPEWISQGRNNQYRYDKVMTVRGMAIRAMRYFGGYPAECVPVLVDAIDTFEEFDPDEGAAEDLSRVATALLPFAAQVPEEAIQKLAARVAKADSQPTDILELLAAMGPRAKSALPALEAFHAKNGGERILGPATTQENDPTGWAIVRIRGERTDVN